MRVWLITVGEPLPMDGADRLFRTGILAELMANHGHDVVFWSSSFDHVRKQQRVAGNEAFRIAANYQIRLLFAPGYNRNISLARHRNHQNVALQFRSQAEQSPLPDVILCSLPTLELCREAVDFGHRHQRPVVLDVRDLWPDLLLNMMPRPLRGCGRLLTGSMIDSVRQSCQQATAITGITDQYVDWGLAHARRNPTRFDRPFPMAYMERPPTEQAAREALEFWNQQGVSPDRGELIACFFGTIGRHFEIEPLIRAAKILAKSERPIRWVFCGTGQKLEHCRRLASGCEQIVFPGWVDAAKIWTLMRMSKIGLTPYVSSQNFVLNLPNKPIEYLSAGLPIVSSLKGVLADLLSKNNCGLTYKNQAVDEIVAAISALQDDPFRLRAMSAKALALYQESFVAEKVYTQMQDYLQAIAADKPVLAAA